MRHKNQKAVQALALVLAFSLTQFYVNATLAGPVVVTTLASTSSLLPQGTGKLVTRSNQSVLVNGTSASTGASILTGSTIETGDGVGATINLGPLGSIDLAPNTKLIVQYDNDGIKLKLLVGCAILNNKKGKNAEISTEQGVAASNEASKGGAAPLDVCFPSGAPNPIVNQGAAANAGAGAGGGSAAAAAASSSGGGVFGLGVAGSIALISGIGAAIIIPIALTRGNNPSPSTP